MGHLAAISFTLCAVGGLMAGPNFGMVELGEASHRGTQN